MALAFGIAGALFRRAMTGEGTVVDTSLLSTAVWMLSSDVTYSQVPGYTVHSKAVSRFPLMEVYQTRDARLIQLMLLDPRPHWQSFCALVGLDDLVDDPRFVDNPARMQNATALSGLIAQQIGAKDWADWKDAFDAWDAPWELIRTIEDVCADPQVHANEMIFDLNASHASNTGHSIFVFTFKKNVFFNKLAKLHHCNLQNEWNSHLWKGWQTSFFFPCAYTMLRFRSQSLFET